MTVYRALADLVVGFHFSLSCFIILGGLLVLRWPRLMKWHLPCVAWGALVEFTGWTCPLTPLENWLRRRGGGIGYEGDFVERYIIPILYPRDLTRTVQIVVGLLVVLVNVAVYWILWKRRRAGLYGPSPQA